MGSEICIRYSFISIGLILQAIFIFDNPMAAKKIVLTVIFLFFTAPTASHAVAKAALMANIIPQCQNGQSVVDESLASTYKGKDLASVLTNHQSDNTAPQDTDELGNKSESL